MKNPFKNEDEFIAALLKACPELWEEVPPNGKRIIHGIRLKTPAEMRASARKKNRADNAGRARQRRGA
jgi:hypothetical protein